MPENGRKPTMENAPAAVQCRHQRIAPPPEARQQAGGVGLLDAEVRMSAPTVIMWCVYSRPAASARRIIR